MLTFWNLIDLGTGDVVGSAKALEEYKQLDPSFTQTRECMLCTDLLDAVEKQDPDVFSEKLFQFGKSSFTSLSESNQETNVCLIDQMSKLDKWKTTMLLRIKNSIEAAGEDFS